MELKQLITSTILEVMRESATSEEMNFTEDEELFFNSVELIQIMARIEQQLGIEIEDEALFDGSVKTVNQFYEHLQKLV